MPHKKGHWGYETRKKVQKKASEIGASVDKNIEKLQILRGTNIHAGAYKRNTKRKVEATKKSPAAKAGISDAERGKLIRRNELFKSDRKAHAKAKAEHNKRQEAKRKQVASDRHKTFKEDRKIKDKGQKSYNKGKPKSEWVDSAYERRQKDADKAMRAAAAARHKAWKEARKNKKK